MKTRQQSLVDFIGSEDVQFVIPVYQRVYSWNEVQCRELWRDTLRAGTLGSEHFVGTVLYSVEEQQGASRQFDIIDGQQRMTTLVIMLAAFADFLQDAGLKFDGIDPSLIRGRFLFTGVAGEQPKLVLSRADRDTLTAVLSGGELPDQVSERVVENYRLFRMLMDEGGQFGADVFWRGAKKLFAIVAELDDDDSPQLVFESLNSKGMPLTTGDLVRNTLLVGASHKEQGRLYHEYWEAIERALGDDPDSTKLNAAVHGWLAIRFPRAHIHDAGEVYDVFKSYIVDVYDGSIEDLLEELKGFCELFGESIQNDPSKKLPAQDWAQGKARTRRGSFDELRGPEVTPLKRDLGSSRRRFT